MFVARTDITNLKVHVEELTKFEADFKERYEETKWHRERIEVLQPLINNLDWLQNYGIAHIANYILNYIELDQAVVALNISFGVVGHRAGYVECTMHVETAFDTQWGTRHCSVNE
ncbi:hypothetical protein Hanom_Chr01g00061831 [Helianthus anomalus]